MASSRAVRGRTASDTAYERARKAMFEEGICSARGCTSTRPARASRTCSTRSSPACAAAAPTRVRARSRSSTSGRRSGCRAPPGSRRAPRCTPPGEVAVSPGGSRATARAAGRRPASWSPAGARGVDAADDLLVDPPDVRLADPEVLGAVHADDLGLRDARRTAPRLRGPQVVVELGDEREQRLARICPRGKVFRAGVPQRRAEQDGALDRRVVAVHQGQVGAERPADQPAVRQPAPRGTRRTRSPRRRRTARRRRCRTSPRTVPARRRHPRRLKRSTATLGERGQPVRPPS